ncbi:Mbeg1-like protein [Dysosmobacter sp.]
MANLLDYLEWRGDLTLSQAPFNEVDNLILAELSFVDFGGIVPAPGEGASVPLQEAAEAFFAGFPNGEKIDMGVLIPDAIPHMLRKMAACRRFQDMKLNCFVDWLDTEKAEQFAALTVETGDSLLYLSFRGTDDTLAGWKEDFHMACLPEVPAQKMAVKYVRDVARQFPRRRLRLGGHSKGGNLAVYAGVFTTAAIQRRIEAIWSNDGPGFHNDLLDLPEHRRVAQRIVSIVPKSSVVGMLLEHEEDYQVVDSTQQGLMQHDGFSWQVLGDHFVRLRSVTRQGHLNDLALKEWVHHMPLSQREKFVDGLFDVLSASGARTLTDLKEESFKSAGAMVKAMKDMEKDTRDALLYAIGLLFRSNMKVLLEEWQQESEKKPRKKWSLKKKEDNA